MAVLLLVCASSPSAAESVSAPLGEYRVPVPEGTTPWVYGLVTERKWEGEMTYSWQAQLTPPVPDPGEGGGSSGTNGGGGGSGAEYMGPVVALLSLEEHVTAAGEWMQHPHYVEVLDGPYAGLVLDILECGPDYVKVGAEGLSLDPGTRLGVHEHATLATMFPGGCGLVAGADMVMAVKHVTGADGNPVQLESWFIYNGTYWEDGGTMENSDDVVVYPGQGILLNVGAAREVTFGSGPVCHVKKSRTLIPIFGSATAVELMGPVWPVEFHENGSLQSVRVLDLGLLPALAPYEDIVCLFSSDGLLQDLAVYCSDGAELVNAVTMETGSLITERFVKGTCLYIYGLQPHYWIAPGLE